MIALSILQPWAWLIVHGPKDVENRRWATRQRGQLLIHAGKKWGPDQREDLAWVRDAFPNLIVPDAFDLGGVVGAAELIDCVAHSESPWFQGPYGFVLEKRRAAPRFVPWKGQLGFFDIPKEAFMTEAHQRRLR